MIFKYTESFINICTVLIRGNVDTNRVKKILLYCSSKQSIKDVIIIAYEVVVRGREDECNLCGSILADWLMNLN